MQISGLQLLYQWWGNGQCHKHRKQPRLHVDVTISKMPKREGVKEAGKNVEHKFALQRSSAK